MQIKILDFLLKEDEIAWQTVLLDLVKTGEMNPWDLNISFLANEYLKKVKEMQQAHLSISGKVLLASALLLKIKADKLLTEGIEQLDKYLYPHEDLENLEDFTTTGSKRIKLDAKPVLTIKTPQARKKRVNLDDLIAALDKALEVSERRVLKKKEYDYFPEEFMPHEETYIDVEAVIGNLYAQVQELFKEKDILSFSELLKENSWKAKISAFVPLLYLYHQSKIDLEQKEPFGEIMIQLPMDIKTKEENL